MSVRDKQSKKGETYRTALAGEAVVGMAPLGRVHCVQRWWRMMAKVFDRDEREDGPLSRVEAGYIRFPASDLEVRFNESGDRASFPLRIPHSPAPANSLGFARWTTPQSAVHGLPHVTVWPRIGPFSLIPLILARTYTGYSCILHGPVLSSFLHRCTRSLTITSVTTARPRRRSFPFGAYLRPTALLGLCSIHMSTSDHDPVCQPDSTVRTSYALTAFRLPSESLPLLLSSPQ